MRNKTNNKHKLGKLCDKLATPCWLGTDYDEEG